MLPGVKKVIEESAYRACLCHLLLRGVYAVAISCAVKELAGALRVGKRAVSSQGRKVSVGVANCLQGWAMKEEMIARILSLQLTYTACARGGVCIHCSYRQSVEPGLSKQLPAFECRHPEVRCHSEPLGVGVGCC
jgi:hypothetical protein